MIRWSFLCLMIWLLFWLLIIYVYFLSLITAHITITEGINDVLANCLNFFELQDNLVLPLDNESLSGQDSIRLLLPYHYPP